MGHLGHHPSCRFEASCPEKPWRLEGQQGFGIQMGEYRPRQPERKHSWRLPLDRQPAPSRSTVKKSKIDWGVPSTPVASGGPGLVLAGHHAAISPSSASCYSLSASSYCQRGTGYGMNCLRGGRNDPRNRNSRIARGP